PAVVVLSIFSVTVLLQKDFSTSVFIFCVGIVLFFASNAKLVWLFPSLLLIIPSGVFMIFQEPYRIDRIIAFMKPEEGVITYNYQSIAAKRAISAGGFWGEGIGSSLKWINRIPEVQADYIFAGWSEAMGFLGVVAYFILLFIFSWRGYRSSIRCMNKFAAFASFGCTTMIVLQSLMNCAVVCGALPSTGIPLPFFSLGGSSIIVTLSMCGFIVNASRRNSKEDIEEESYEISKVNGVPIYE
ncbi:MAG: FtsW/RodA/SpoVE family cell cycle protein, partial [Treponema sp.]|nr:FtsW/RodA/SpoVE family cell cycle protein [Treponema sp.]